MGFLDRIIRKSKPEVIQLLEEGITKLRIGIFGRLLRKYTPIHGEAQSKLLSVAILNDACRAFPTLTASH